LDLSVPVTQRHRWQEKLQRYSGYFDKYDHQRRQFLDYDEFQEVVKIRFRRVLSDPPAFQFLREVGKKNLGDEQRDRCFIYVNKSANGKISFEEFVKGVDGLYACDFDPELDEHALEMLSAPAEEDDETDGNGLWGSVDTVINVTA